MLLLLVFDRGLANIFFESRIGAEFLLNQIAQFQHRRLQDLQALLKLRSKDLLLGEGLRLGQTCHGR